MLTSEVVSGIFRSHGVLPLVWIVENNDRLGWVNQLDWGEADEEISVVPVLTLKEYMASCSALEDAALKLSINFLERIPQCLIKQSKHHVLNVHQSFLPWNRGHWPEVWAILEDTPIGITIHEVVHEWDRGDILYQKSAKIHKGDTAASLGSRLNKLALEVTVEQFPNLVFKNLTKTPQADILPMRTLEQLKSLRHLTFEQWSYLSEEQRSKLLRALYNPPYFSSVTLRFSDGACANVEWSKEH